MALAYNLALICGEEFSDAFQAIHAGLAADRRGKPREVFLPTPAADDAIETVEHWCSLAREKLSVLGAIVDTPRVIDCESADDPRHAEQMAEADWVYLSGGYGHVALPILQDTKVDESTTLARNIDGSWKVSGLGSVTVHKQGPETVRYAPGSSFVL